MPRSINSVDLFRRQGFCEFGPLLDKNQCQRLVSIASMSLEPNPIDSIGGTNLFDEAPSLLPNVVIHESVIDFMNSVLGQGACLNGCSLVGVSNSANQQLSWHRDIFGRVPFGEGYEHPNAVNLLIYLQDLDEQNGPLHYLPASHRERRELQSCQKSMSQADEKTICAKAGHAVIIHNNLVHSRGINRSECTRYNLSFVFSACYIASNIALDRPDISRVRAKMIQAGMFREGEMLGDKSRYRDLINSGFLNES